MAQSRATVTPPHAPSAGPKPRGRGRPTLAQSDLPAHTAFARFVTTCTLDRAASSPLWVQVKNALSHGIETGQLAPNSRLPSASGGGWLADDVGGGGGGGCCG